MNTKWGGALPVGAVASTSKHSIMGLGGPDNPIVWGSGVGGSDAFSATAFAGLDTYASPTGTGVKLYCVSCHDPHAFGATYRMLARRPGADGMSGIAKHPAPSDPAWKQFVYVTDQFDYARMLIATDPVNGAARADQVLSYVTDNYNRPVAYVDDKGTADPADDETIYYTTVDRYYLDTSVTPPVWKARTVTRGTSTWNEYSQQLNQYCAACHDRYNALKKGGATTADSYAGATGSNPTGDAIYAYRHKTGSYIDPAGGLTTDCAYGCHLNKQLACLNCHVAHGTSSKMGPIVQAMAWPGEGGPATYDGMTMPATAAEDPQRTGKYTDYDGDSRSNLLRINNRGVCQNSDCHVKGDPEAYLAGH